LQNIYEKKELLQKLEHDNTDLQQLQFVQNFDLNVLFTCEKKIMTGKGQM
jgi:hypothetical protein